MGMKRLLSLAVLGTAALLLPSSVINAQMRGGHAGGGGGFHSSGGSAGFRSSGPSGGFRSSGSAGFRSGGMSGFRSSGFRTSGVGVRSGGFRSFGARSGVVSRGGFATRGGFASRGTFASRSVGFTRFGNRNVFIGAGFRRFGFGRFGFFDRCFGCFSPFFFSSGFFLGSPFYPYYYPYYPGDYYGYGGYGPSYYSQPVANNDNGDTAQLSADVQRLSDEVADLRDDQGYSHFTDRGPVPPGTSLSANSPAAATVFIFHDGNRISGQNYAITGQTLWIFNEHSARKFQLSDLDVAATEKANAANGVEFHAPGGEDRH
jgi:hypothetical protein